MTRLEQMRLDAHLSRAGLSKVTGVPARTIRCLESGTVRKPRLETVGPLAEHFAVAVSELVADFTAVYDELKAAA